MKSEMGAEKREEAREREKENEMKHKKNKTLSCIYCITHGLLFFVASIKYMERNTCHAMPCQRHNNGKVRQECCAARDMRDVYMIAPCSICCGYNLTRERLYTY